MTEKIKIYPYSNKHTAFSLVEMLMALLVASLLLSALAPVMTKRFGSEKVGVLAYNSLGEKKVCGYVNDTFEDIKAEDCIAPDDAYYGSAIIVSGGGGGGGAVDHVISSNKVLTYDGPSTASSTVSQSQYEFTFDKNINTINIKMLAGGGGAGGGNFNTAAAPNDTNCANISGSDTTGKTNYAVYDSLNNFCVTKYNQVSNPSDYTTYRPSVWSDTKCTSNYQYISCDSSQKSMPYMYSGCGRPLCTHAGAVVACSNLSTKTGISWRLPKKAELEKWMSQYEKFALCTSYNSGTAYSKTAMCKNDNLEASTVYSGLCGEGWPQGQYGDCNHKPFPFYVWGEEKDEVNTYEHYGFLLGTIANVKAQYMYSGNLDSVRCVTNKATAFHTGGGGGASSTLSMPVPQEVIKYATENGNTGLLKIYAGAGGKGGPKQNSTRGTNGSPSRVEVYAKSTSGALTLIWAIQIEGGYAGGGASTTNAGIAGYTREYGYCNYLHKSIADGNYDTEVKGKCVSLSLPGFGPGWSAAGYNGDHATFPGGGGKAYWSLSDPGSDTPKNSTGARGSGGGGGICYLLPAGSVWCTDGGNGGSGKVEITYTTKAPGIGGSGGGAGGLLHIMNFEVNPKDVVKIQAGKKGKGGGSGVDGQNGGESYIEINGRKYSVSGGGGGKTGTAGVPPVDNLSNPTMPLSGDAGIGGKTTSIIGSKFDGGDGGLGIGISNNSSISQGGNGGMNSKISMFADIPCGGLSNISVNGVACNRSSNIPTILTRALTKDDFNSAFKSTYGAGATGGGGGGWNGSLTAGTTSSSGADGLGGYIFVYFGGW